MGDGDALLAAILANPDDDTPRLVYADWLQENGKEEFAEFIRVQCRIARWFPTRCPGAPHGPPGSPPTPGCDCAARGALRRREQELYVALYGFLFWKYGAYVTLGTPGDFHDGAFVVRIHRGFASEVRCTAADWFAHGDEIRKAHPVTRVTLTTWPDIPDVSVSDPLGVGRLTRYYRVAGRRVTMTEDNGVGQGTAYVLAARWKGVTFEVPPEFAVV